MDDSLVEAEVMVELEAAVLQAATWAEVLVTVRAWAAKHWFLPCTTIPNANGLRIAYHDEAEGCKQVFVKLPRDHADTVCREYVVGKGGW